MGAAPPSYVGTKFSDNSEQKTVAQPSNFVAKTTAYTAVVGDYVLADATSGAFTITLPANPVAGALVGAKKIDLTGNLPTVAPSGGGTIDGDPFARLATQWAGAIFEHQGSNVWSVIAVSLTTPGPQGAQGFQGTPGAQGAPGNNGSQGSPGVQGATGPSIHPSVMPISGANNVLLPLTNIASAAAAAPALNAACFLPIFIAQSLNITALACNVTTAAVGGTSPVARLGLFNDRGDNTGPGTLIIDGTTTITATGIRQVATVRTLTPGLYWVSFVFQYSVVPTTLPQFTSMNTVQPLPGPSMTSISYRCLLLAGVSGAMASNPAPTPNAQQAPVVGLIAA